MIPASAVRAAARLAWLPLFLSALTVPLPSQRNLAGEVQTRLALARLNVLGGVLMIGAHPDDENTALIAYLARGRKARVAYLSLTRGDGGQNLIGPEQGELLGLIRTQELLAARRIDGGEQFCTRAVDFGFSKTAEETFAKWGHEAILADVVWTVRRFRPDVVVIGVSGGHGHHQAAGILAREAFAAAADKTRFPELGAEDLVRGDLGRFDAIVAGVRAYNVRADLVANQQRLLEYARNGGTLVVQYVVADFRSQAGPQGIGPYPLQIGRARVSVEDAPVVLLNPQHRLLTTPNRIGEEDFRGWVQERGLNFASQWDSRYEPLLESHDPNEEPLRGGTLYTRYGRGAYVFTSYSWFRQLPAGVPGAFRIFANFLSAGRSVP